MPSLKGLPCCAAVSRAEDADVGPGVDDVAVRWWRARALTGTCGIEEVSIPLAFVQCAPPSSERETWRLRFGRSRTSRRSWSVWLIASVAIVASRGGASEKTYGMFQVKSSPALSLRKMVPWSVAAWQVEASEELKTTQVNAEVEDDRPGGDVFRPADLAD
jgi:hypothetical protein